MRPSSFTRTVLFDRGTRSLLQIGYPDRVPLALAKLCAQERL